MSISSLNYGFRDEATGFLVKETLLQSGQCQSVCHFSEVGEESSSSVTLALWEAYGSRTSIAEFSLKNGLKPPEGI